jgi:hypothetical protein
MMAGGPVGIREHNRSGRAGRSPGLDLSEERDVRNVARASQRFVGEGGGFSG